MVQRNCFFFLISYMCEGKCLHVNACTRKSYPFFFWKRNRLFVFWPPVASQVPDVPRAAGAASDQPDLRQHLVEPRGLAASTGWESWVNMGRVTWFHLRACQWPSVLILCFSLSICLYFKDRIFPTVPSLTKPCPCKRVEGQSASPKRHAAFWSSLPPLILPLCGLFINSCDIRILFSFPDGCLKDSLWLVSAANVQIWAERKKNEYSLFLWIGVLGFFYHVPLCVLIIINVNFIKTDHLNHF